MNIERMDIAGIILSVITGNPFLVLIGIPYYGTGVVAAAAGMTDDVLLRQSSWVPPD